MVNFDGRLLFFGQLFHLGMDDYENKEEIIMGQLDIERGERLMSEIDGIRKSFSDNWVIFTFLSLFLGCSFRLKS